MRHAALCSSIPAASHSCTNGLRKLGQNQQQIRQQNMLHLCLLKHVRPTIEFTTWGVWLQAKNIYILHYIYWHWGVRDHRCQDVSFTAAQYQVTVTICFSSLVETGPSSKVPSCCCSGLAGFIHNFVILHLRIVFREFWDWHLNCESWLFLQFICWWVVGVRKSHQSMEMVHLLFLKS